MSQFLTLIPTAARVAGLILVVAGSGCGTPQRLDWEQVEQMIADRFPEVSRISTAELAEALAAPAPSVLLLDTRTPEEYAVSHLPGAILVTSASQAADIVRATAPETLVVAYCSVGYRSAALVEQLRDEGLPAVVNLTGSIFAWANEGRLVYRDNAPVSQVHPYDESWGVLLDRTLWSEPAGS